jgi:hypothetical protein
MDPGSPGHGMVNSSLRSPENNPKAIIFLTSTGRITAERPAASLPANDDLGLSSAKIQKMYTARPWSHNLAAVDFHSPVSPPPMPRPENENENGEPKGGERTGIMNIEYHVQYNIACDTSNDLFYRLSGQYYHPIIPNSQVSTKFQQQQPSRDILDHLRVTEKEHDLLRGLRSAI